MKKYLLSEPVPIPPVRREKRWAWLLFGCLCLVVGSAYLGTADLTNGAGVAERQEILTSTDEAP
ncbi:MAG: hypothetical protein AAFQ95_00365 [Cyanobacteria bacterium J06621_3]